MSEAIIGLIIFLGGIIAGLYGSAVGSGGLVSFPVLLLAGLPTHVAIATNRFAALFLEASASARFWKDKQLNVKYSLLLGVVAAVGAIIGSAIVLNINEIVLDFVVSSALLVTFIFLVSFKKFKVENVDEKKGKLAIVLPGVFLLGIYGGFFGAGFGTFIMVLLVAFGSSFIKSAAISRVVGTLMSLAATMSFIFYGVVDFRNGILLGIGYAVGGWVGAGITTRKGERYVRILLSLVIVLSVAKLLSPHLLGGSLFTK